MKNHISESGRIIVPNSDNIGRFVSPKNLDFLENVEKGVADLVLACLSRGLVTVSSCEGHPEDEDNREVTLAFRSISDCEKFIKIIPDYRITITDDFFGGEDCGLQFAFGQDYSIFVTIWIDQPDVDEKTKELQRRILGLLI